MRGWKLGHRASLPGSPDFIFIKKRLAVFVDGCFWHGCRRCRCIPVTNRTFWATKIAANKSRDKKVNRMLLAMGWKVIRIWEHELRGDPSDVLQRVKINLSRR